MKDYDLTIQYHPEQDNVVVDALSWKSGGSLSILVTHQPKLLRDLEEMQVEVQIVDSSSIMSQLNQVSVYDKIKEAQQEDSQMKKIQEKIQRGELNEFGVINNVLKLGHWLCVSEVAEIRKEIMKEAHCIPYTAQTQEVLKCIRICGIIFCGMGWRKILLSLYTNA